MTTIINLTPHAIHLNDGRSFNPSGNVARVSAQFTPNSNIDGVETFQQVFGEVENLPQPELNTFFIVSAIVLEAARRSGRTDVVAPATGHPLCVRNDKGHIVSVPGFV